MKTRSILLAALIAAVPVLVLAQQPPKTATIVDRKGRRLPSLTPSSRGDGQRARQRTRGRSPSWGQRK